MTNLSYKSLLIILFFVLIPVVLLLRINQKPDLAEAGWWNPSWTYRQAITVTNNESSQLTNYQIPVTINTQTLISSNKLQSDCQDLRFALENGTQINYWIEENNPGCNQTNTKVWLKLPSLTASTDTTIYVYYGNPSASSNNSNIKDVFVQAIDFSTDTVNSYGSSQDASANNHWQINSDQNYIRFGLGSSASNNWKYVSVPSLNITSGNYKIDFAYKSDSNQIEISGLGHDTVADSATLETGKTYRIDGTQAWGITPSSTYDRNTGDWQFFSILLDDYTGTHDAIIIAHDNDALTISDDYFKDIRVRKYTVNPPTTSSPGTTESQSQLGSAGIGSTDPNFKENLIAHYRFDKGVGTTAYDSVASNHGIFAIGNSAPTWTQNGKFNSALSFDGNDYTQLHHTSLDQLGTENDFTISAWTYHSSFNNIEAIICQAYGAHVYGRFLVGTNNSKAFISLYGGNSSPSYKQITGQIDLATNTWNQITAIFSKTENLIKLYVNGQFDSQLSWDNYIENIETNHVNLGFNTGRPQSPSALTGLIDQVKIYSTALSPAQIALDYNQGSALVMGQTTSDSGSTAPGGSSSQKYCVPGSTDPCSPPVAEWKFDEGQGTQAYDTSGNNLTATANSANQWRPGKIGKSFYSINSTSSKYLTVGTDSQLNLLTTPSDSATFQAWVKTPYTGTYGHWVADKKVAFSTGSGYTFLIYQQKVFLQFRDDSDNIINLWSSRANLADDQWHHIAVAIDRPTTSYQVYVDGLLDNQGTFTQIGTLDHSSKNFYIGNRYGTDDLTRGNLDNFIIYDYVRTPSQIAWDYNRGAPIAHYRLDECSGTTIHSANDTYDPSLNGTLNIGPSGYQSSAGTCSAASDAAWSNGASGKINSALFFDGTDDSIQINQSIWPETGEFTVSAWAKYAQATSYRGIVSNYESGQGGRTYLGLLNNQATGFVSGTRVTGSTLESNTWYFLTLSRDSSGNIKLYKNAVLEDTNNNSSSIYQKNTEIGELNGEYFFNGQIDDVKIFSYALTSKQIKTLYNGAAIRFDGNVFTGAYDAFEASLARVYEPARRTLTSYTGPLIRLKRLSDNAESDFGYVANGDLDVAAIATWLGESDNEVVAIYDQKGNDEIVPYNTAMKYVASAKNGHAGIQSSAGNEMRNNGGTALAAQPYVRFAVTQMDLDAAIAQGRASEMLAWPRIYWYNQVYGFVMYAGGSGMVKSYDQDSDWHVWSAVFNTTATALYDNGSLTGTGSVQPSGAASTWGDSYYYFTGYICSDIWFDGLPSDADRIAMETAINDYWGIY